MCHVKIKLAFFESSFLFVIFFVSLIKTIFLSCQIRIEQQLSCQIRIEEQSAPMEESDNHQSVGFGTRVGQKLSQLSEEEVEQIEEYVDKGVDVICQVVSAIGPWQKVRFAFQSAKSLKTAFVKTSNAKGKVEFYVRKPPESKELHILLENVEARRTAGKTNTKTNKSQSWPMFGQKTKTSGVGLSTIKYLQDYARNEGYSEFRFLVHNLRHQSSSESLVPPDLRAPTLKMNVTGATKQGSTVNEIPETISRAYSLLQKRYEVLPTEIVRHPTGERIVCYAYRIPSTRASIDNSHLIYPSTLHHNFKEELQALASHTAYGSHTLSHLHSHDTNSHVNPITSTFHHQSPPIEPEMPMFPILDPLRAWTQFSLDIAPQIKELDRKRKRDLGEDQKNISFKNRPFILPTWNYLQSFSNTIQATTPSIPPPRVAPLSLLQKRITQQPRIQNEIHTQVIQEQTGGWGANQTTCHIGPDGNVWTVDPSTKKITQVQGDTSALRPHLLPYSQCLLSPGAHFSYPGGHKEVINLHSVPMPPPPPPIRQRYCGKIFDGLTRSWKEDKCNKCAQSGFPGAHCDQSF